MENFVPHEISFEDMGPGDVIVWRREGLVAGVLSWLIQKLKEPGYSRWGWHTTPVVATNKILDAQFPKVKVSYISDYLAKGRNCRVYRVFPHPLPDWQLEKFTKSIVGKHYDFLVYIWTTISKLFGFIRIINKRYSCWEVTWAFLDYFGFEPLDNSDFDIEYPWLPDFLRCVGEMAIKRKA